MLLLLGLLAALEPPAAPPSSIPEPPLAVGDTWLFDFTIERGPTSFKTGLIQMRVQRIDPDDMLIGMKVPGAPGDYQDHLTARDWGELQLLDGRQTRTLRPLAFPLTVGKRWSIDYENTQLKAHQISVRIRADYKVVGWEDVTTLAGTFHALRIEERARIDAKVGPAAGGAVGGAMAAQGLSAFGQMSHSAAGEVHHEGISRFDYVSDVRAIVKSVEEQYDARGVRLSRDTRELVKFTPAS